MCKSVAFLAAMLILVAVVSVVGKDKDKEDKYKGFKCYHQDLGSGDWSMKECDKKEEPKGCVVLTGCQNQGKEHEHRKCFDKDFRKKIKNWMNLDDKPDGYKFCDILRNHPNTPSDYNCTYCMVCDPKSGRSYCNADFGGIHGGVNTGVMALAIGLLLLAMAMGPGTMGI